MSILSPTQSRGRVLNRVCVIVIALLLPTGLQAEPVSINQVRQIISSRENGPDLRLRALTQTSTAISAISSRANGSAAKKFTSATRLVTDSLFLIPHFQSDQKPTNVVVVNQGNVEGTICDCGEILVAGGDFPKWPLLFLGAIPFFLIDSDDSDSSPLTAPAVLTPLPLATPGPPSTPAIPEPASLILFGPGLLALLAAFRRRNTRMKDTGSAQIPEGR